MDPASPDAAGRPTVEAPGLKQWHLRPREEADLLGQRTLKPVEMFLERVHEAYPEPATPDYALVAMTSGHSERVRCDLGHGVFELHGRRLMVLTPPGHHNRFEGPGGYRLLLAVFPPTRVRAVCADAGLPAPDLGRLHAGSFHDARLERLLGALWEEDHGGGPHGRLYAEGLFTALVARLLTLNRTSPPAAPRRARLSSAAVAKVDALLRERLEVGVGVGALAERVGYSRFHFSRLYKEATGVSPGRRMIQLRVQRAQELLREKPHWTVAAVAAACGFGDQSHLSRHFRVATGTTPARWRARL